MLSDFWQFVVALFWGWLTIMSGALAAAVAFYERAIKKREVTQRLYLLIVAVFIFVAAFFAWRDQLNATRAANTSLEQAQQQLNQKDAKIDQLEKPRKPSFTGWLENYGTGTDQEGTTLFYVDASVDNAPDAAPSIAEGFRLTITMPGIGQTPTLFPEWGNGKELKLSNATEESTRNPNEILFQKTTLHPIAAGARVSGWLKYTVHGFTPDQVMRDGNTFEITFADLQKVTYVMRHTMDSRTDHQPAGHVPGIDYAVTPKSRRNK